MFVYTGPAARHAEAGGGNGGSSSAWDARLTPPLLQLFWDPVVNGGHAVGDDVWAGEFFSLWTRCQQMALSSSPAP